MKYKILLSFLIVLVIALVGVNSGGLGREALFGTCENPGLLARVSAQADPCPDQSKGATACVGDRYCNCEDLIDGSADGTYPAPAGASCNILDVPGVLDCSDAWVLPGAGPVTADLGAHTLSYRCQIAAEAAETATPPCPAGCVETGHAVFFLEDDGTCCDALWMRDCGIGQGGY